MVSHCNKTRSQVPHKDRGVALAHGLRDRAGPWGDTAPTARGATTETAAETQQELHKGATTTTAEVCDTQAVTRVLGGIKICSALL